MIEDYQVCVKCLNRIVDGKCPQCGEIYNIGKTCEYCGSYLFGNPLFHSKRIEKDSIAELDSKIKTGICSNLNCFGYKKVEQAGWVTRIIFKAFAVLNYSFETYDKYKEVAPRYVVYQDFLILTAPYLPDSFHIHKSILDKLNNRFYSME